MVLVTFALVVLIIVNGACPLMNVLPADWAEILSIKKVEGE